MKLLYLDFPNIFLKRKLTIIWLNSTICWAYFKLIQANIPFISQENIGKAELFWCIQGYRNWILAWSVTASTCFRIFHQSIIIQKMLEETKSYAVKELSEISNTFPKFHLPIFALLLMSELRNANSRFNDDLWRFFFISLKEMNINPFYANVSFLYLWFSDALKYVHEHRCEMS